MTYKLLDTVVLDRDRPQYGLRKGDLGAVVEVHDADGLEVEFVRPRDASCRRCCGLVGKKNDERAPRWLGAERWM